MTRKAFIPILTLIYQLSYGQFSHQSVLPGINGTALVSELKVRYRPPFTLDYSVARDTLFSRIDRYQDSLACIYTGMKLYLTPGVDPTEAVYLGGVPNGINTEHAWPQGKGAIGQAQSDMHHLFPSRIKTNADRGDFPFGDIPDSETKTWYLKATERSSPPATNRDAYSEYTPGKFEPRESVKGNIARAMFYFYTMYRELADNADATFFSKMQVDLCDWHYQDPVDETEWFRNKKIATYQGGKENPFVLDCSLVSRGYCNNIDQACEALLASAGPAVTTEIKELKVFPNPGFGTVTIQTTGRQGSKISLQVFTLAGNSIYSTDEVVIGVNGLAELDLQGLPAACYLMQISFPGMSRPQHLLYCMK